MLFPRWVALCFLQGAGLPDPHGRLKGEGSLVRHIRLENLGVLDDPEVQSLMNLALHRAKASLNPRNRRQLIIKSVFQAAPAQAYTKPRIASHSF